MPDDKQAELLLGRTPRPLSLDSFQSGIRGAPVMVTGGGGFIGSEICRTLVSLGASVVAVDNNEYALTSLAETVPQSDIALELLDIRDLARVETLLSTAHPSHVYHAAAYKHVPFLEGFPIEAIQNNVLATAELARACNRSGVKRFVFVSSDKAASSANVLGVSKRLAELLISSRPTSETNFASIRCANVLGSPGSLLPRALDQIARGGPLTLTSSSATRYFMTLRETAHAILYAGHLPAIDGILIPDAGKPVSILALLTKLIDSYAGHNGDMRIELVGLRPGDRESELLVSDQEQAELTPCRNMRVARIQRTLQHAQSETLIGHLASYCRNRDAAGLRRYVQSVLLDCM